MKCDLAGRESGSRRPRTFRRVRLSRAVRPFSFKTAPGADVVIDRQTLLMVKSTDGVGPMPEGPSGVRGTNERL